MSIPPRARAHAEAGFVVVQAALAGWMIAQDGETFLLLGVTLFAIVYRIAYGISKKQRIAEIEIRLQTAGLSDVLEAIGRVDGEALRREKMLRDHEAAEQIAERIRNGGRLER